MLFANREPRKPLAKKSGRVADLQRELGALFAAQNASGRPDRTTIPAIYLRVTVSVQRSLERRSPPAPLTRGP